MGRRKEKDREIISESISYIRLPKKLKEMISQKAKRENVKEATLMRGILHTFLDFWNDLEKKENEQISFYKIIGRVIGGEKNKCKGTLDKNKKRGIIKSKRRQNE